MKNKLNIKYYQCTKCKKDFIIKDGVEFYSTTAYKLLKKQPDLSVCKKCRNL